MCSTLASILAACVVAATPTRTPQKTPAAAPYADIDQRQKACDGGDARGCFVLGLAYDTGVGVAHDEAKAAELYRKACDGGEARGCSSLGFAYYYGAGVVQDQAKAAQLYQKACDGGGAEGCSNLGRMYERGQGVAEDRAKAAQLYQKASEAISPRDDVLDTLLRGLVDPMSLLAGLSIAMVVFTAGLVMGGIGALFGMRKTRVWDIEPSAWRPVRRALLLAGVFALLMTGPAFRATHVCTSAREPSEGEKVCATWTRQPNMNIESLHEKTLGLGRFLALAMVMGWLVMRCNRLERAAIEGHQRTEVLRIELRDIRLLARAIGRASGGEDRLLARLCEIIAAERKRDRDSGQWEHLAEMEERRAAI